MNLHSARSSISTTCVLSGSRRSRHRHRERRRRRRRRRLKRRAAAVTVEGEGEVRGELQSGRQMKPKVALQVQQRRRDADSGCS